MLLGGLSGGIRGRANLKLNLGWFLICACVVWGFSVNFAFVTFFEETSALSFLFGVLSGASKLHDVEASVSGNNVAVFDKLNFEFGTNISSGAPRPCLAD